MNPWKKALTLVAGRPEVGKWLLKSGVDFYMAFPCQDELLVDGIGGEINVGYDEIEQLVILKNLKFGRLNVVNDIYSLREMFAGVQELNVLFVDEILTICLKG